MGEDKGAVLEQDKLAYKGIRKAMMTLMWVMYYPHSLQIVPLEFTLVKSCLETLTALEFFQLFFTAQMVNNIVSHTNSYAWEHITDGTHQAYASSDGSWEETTPQEINKLMALLIYFGLVRVSSHVDKYWSTKTLYHGLWARPIMLRLRYRALMAFLHVVDPATEALGNKLRKVESFLTDFKARCLSLY